MAALFEDISYLSQEIGPRPAGTEEEQQAALYIADELQKSSGFPTVIEDFNCITNPDLLKLICFGVGALMALLAIIFPGIALICAIIGFIAFLLYFLEYKNKPILSRFLNRGVSQNVVAKYQPPKSNISSRRKIILVAGYDSGKVMKEHQNALVESKLNILQIASFIALLAVPVINLLHGLLFPSDSGVLLGIVNFIVIVGLIALLLPVVSSILHRLANYNQAANNNAAGVAVMMDVARKLGNGVVSVEEMQEAAENQDVTVQGEAAAREADAVPEGAELAYEVDEHQSSEESLAAAKAAIAALTGRPVADKVPVSDISSKLVQYGEDAMSATSGVHFEVDENIPEFDEAIKSASIATPVNPEEYYEEIPVHKQEIAEQVQAEAAPPAQAEVETDAAPAAGVVAEVAAGAAASFVRETPEALRAGATGMGTAVDNIPAWARAAQTKAHANHPELNTQDAKVSRSRFADTVAARISDGSYAEQLQNSAGATPVSQSDAPANMYAAAQTFASSEPMTELEASLAALRNEIESAKAPSISAEAQEAFDYMGEEQPAAPVADSVAIPATAPMDVPSPKAAQSVEPKVEEKPTPAAEEAEQSTAPISAAEINKAITEKPVQSSETPAEPAEAPAETGRVVVAAEKELAEAILPSEQIDHKPEVAPAAAVVERRATARATAPHMREGKSMKSIFAQKRASLSPMDVSSLFKKNEEAVAPLDLEDVAPVEELPVQVEENAAEIAVQALNASVAPVKEAAEVKAVEEAEETAPVSLKEIKEAVKAEAAPAPEALSTEKPVIEPAPAPLPAESAQKTATLPKQGFKPTARPSVRAKQQPQAKASSPVLPIKGMEKMAASLPRISQEFPVVEGDNKAEAVVVLPDVAPNRTADTTIGQRAPMAEIAETGRGSSPLLSSMIPRISDDMAKQAKEGKPFGADLPSLSDDVEHNMVSTTGSFSTVGGTGAFAPVGDELVADIDPEDRYIDDADDSSYEQSHTETGAFAGPGYMDMPKSRTKGFFGRFRKKSKQPEISVGQSIGAGEDYSARKVGAERGSWESFRQEDELPTTTSDAQFVDVDFNAEGSFKNPRGWNGGAFSLSRLRKGLQRPAKEGPLTDEEMVEELPENIDQSAEDNVYIAADVSEGVARTNELNRELEKMRNFRHPGIDSEVWFVALGAEMSNNSGMEAFIAEHESELHGAIIINLEALGSGSLSFLEKEGKYQPVSVSSRMKRFLRGATEKTGVSFATRRLETRETASSCAIRHGHQAMTIAGMDGLNTALYGQPDDVVENLNEQTLKQNSEFVMAILKSM